MGHDDSRPGSAWDAIDDPILALGSRVAGLFRWPEVDASWLKPSCSPELLARLSLHDISPAGLAMLDATEAASDWAREAEERSRVDALLRGAADAPDPDASLSHTATWPTSAEASEEPDGEEAPWPYRYPSPPPARPSAAPPAQQPVSIRLLIDDPTLGLVVLGQTEPAVFDGTRSLRLVIDDPHLGPVVLGWCEAPILDGTTVIQLVIDDPTLGPTVIGWSTNHPEYLALQALAGPPVTLIPLEQSTTYAAASYASSHAPVELASWDGADGDDGSLGSGDDLVRVAASGPDDDPKEREEYELKRKLHLETPQEDRDHGHFETEIAPPPGPAGGGLSSPPVGGGAGPSGKGPASAGGNPTPSAPAHLHDPGEGAGAAPAPRSGEAPTQPAARAGGKLPAREAPPPGPGRPATEDAYEMALRARDEQNLREVLKRFGKTDAEIETAVENSRGNRNDGTTPESYDPALAGQPPSPPRTPRPVAPITFEEAVAEAIRESKGVGGTFLRFTGGPFRMVNPDPSLGPAQVRYNVDFVDGFGKLRNFSVNYDPETGEFGIIKLSSKNWR